MPTPKTWLFLTAAASFVGITLTGGADRGAMPTTAPTAGHCAGAGFSASSNPATIDDRARAVLDRSLATYRSLKSYLDTTQVRVLGEERDERNTLSLAFKRPARMAVLWRREGDGEDAVRLSDGVLLHQLLHQVIPASASESRCRPPPTVGRFCTLILRASTSSRHPRVKRPARSP